MIRFDRLIYSMFLKFQKYPHNGSRTIAPEENCPNWMLGQNLLVVNKGHWVNIKN